MNLVTENKSNLPASEAGNSVPVDDSSSDDDSSRGSSSSSDDDSSSDDESSSSATNADDKQPVPSGSDYSKSRSTAWSSQKKNETTTNGIGAAARLKEKFAGAGGGLVALGLVKKDRRSIETIQKELDAKANRQPRSRLANRSSGFSLSPSASPPLTSTSTANNSALSSDEDKFKPNRPRAASLSAPKETLKLIAASKNTARSRLAKKVLGKGKRATAKKATTGATQKTEKAATVGLTNSLTSSNTKKASNNSANKNGGEATRNYPVKDTYEDLKAEKSMNAVSSSEDENTIPRGGGKGLMILGKRKEKEEEQHENSPSKKKKKKSIVNLEPKTLLQQLSSILTKIQLIANLTTTGASIEKIQRKIVKYIATIGDAILDVFDNYRTNEANTLEEETHKKLWKDLWDFAASFTPLTGHHLSLLYISLNGDQAIQQNDLILMEKNLLLN